MKPTPRTVWISGGSPSLRRRCETQRSTAFRVLGRLSAPHALKRKRAADHLSRVAEQQLEHLGLPCAQGDLALPSPHTVRPDVEDEVVEGKQLIRFAAAAQERACPREQLLGCERLDQVVICARIQSGHTVGTASRAVNSRIGTARPRLRSRRQTASPSIPGMAMSSTSESATKRSTAASAAPPSAAASTR